MVEVGISVVDTFNSTGHVNIRLRSDRHYADEGRGFIPLPPGGLFSPGERPPYRGQSLASGSCSSSIFNSSARRVMWRSALRVRARTCHTVSTVVIDHRGVKGVRRTVSHRPKIGPALEGKTSVCLPRRLGGILARHEPTNYWSGGDRRVLGADAGRVCEPAGRDVLWWALRQHRLRRCRRLHCRTSWCCLGVPGVNG